MSKPTFDDEKDWLDFGQGKVLLKDLKWQEIKPGELYVTSVKAYGVPHTVSWWNGKLSVQKGTR